MSATRSRLSYSSVQLLPWNGRYGHLTQYPDLYVISTYLHYHMIQFLPFSRNLSSLSGIFQLPLEVTCVYSHCTNLTLSTACCDNAVICPKGPWEIPAAQWVKFKILHSKITYSVLCPSYVPIQFSVCLGTHCSHKSKQYHDLSTLFLYNPSTHSFPKHLLIQVSLENLFQLILVQSFSTFLVWGLTSLNLSLWSLTQ